MPKEVRRGTTGHEHLNEKRKYCNDLAFVEEDFACLQKRVTGVKCKVVA
jgi:hypothetical protein